MSCQPARCSASYSMKVLLTRNWKVFRTKIEGEWQLQSSVKDSTTSLPSLKHHLVSVPSAAETNLKPAKNESCNDHTPLFRNVSPKMKLYVWVMTQSTQYALWQCRWMWFLPALSKCQTGFFFYAAMCHMNWKIYWQKPYHVYEQFSGKVTHTAMVNIVWPSQMSIIESMHEQLSPCNTRTFFDL